ncbi:hypothetical protein D9613_006979 [Agrocybe pediades]|uniref:F-box domain-containing protein n=1 Tax=Agrocybe pediades TaxID=84607 RepID=A0A8H4VID0_9AGAR|nr:hypothetical protein D9613_006979 [Agrocybe pediades]
MPLRSGEQRLPQEIFDQVIDFFHDDSIQLRVCALVSPAWLSSARLHLFHNIYLSPPSGPRHSSFFFTKPNLSPCRKLYDCIERSNRSLFGGVSKYIQALHVCEGTLARQWIAREPTLPLLLQSLENLRRFEISQSASVHIDWDDLPKALRDSVEEHVLKLPSLTELRLGSLYFRSVVEFTKILQACRGLRQLEVDHIDFESESVDVLQDGEGSAFVEPTPLDILVIGPRTSPALIRTLLHPSSGITTAALRKLAMSISGDFAEFAKLLQASNAVQSLEFTLMNDTSLDEYFNLPPSNQFDLSQVQYLNHLEVNIDVLQKLEDPLPWLTTLLRTGINPTRSTQKNAIRTILITYSVYLPAPYMDRSINTTIFGRWREIDMILCGMSSEGFLEDGQRSHAYGNLQSVCLEFMLENPIGSGVAPRFLREMILPSPGLRALDMLTVVAFDTSR